MNTLYVEKISQFDRQAEPVTVSIPFADKYTSILLFAGEAASLGLLDWYEYPFYDL
jgi:hypothetical protein